MKWFAILFGAVWIAGWIATLRNTQAGDGAKLWQRILGPVVLFFVWPWVSWRMTYDH